MNSNVLFEATFALGKVLFEVSLSVKRTIILIPGCLLIKVTKLKFKVNKVIKCACAGHLYSRPAHNE